jgi:hypothetical protein
MKKIEIEVPEGYVAKEEKTENGINIIFVKEDKEKEMKEFLREQLNGCVIRLDDNYPNIIFYEKKNKIDFELYKNVNTVYVHKNIWCVFENKYNMNYSDIQVFIKKELESILKMESIGVCRW